MGHRISWRAALIVVALVATACGHDGTTAARDLDDAAEPAGRPVNPGSEAPAGQDVEAVEPLVAELLHAYDQVVNDIYADAAAVDDADHELLDDLRDLFAPESEQIAYLVDGWLQEDGAGEDPDTDAHFLQTELQTVESETEDRVSFVTCVETRLYVADDAAGDQRAVGYESHVGQGRAVRVEGGWLLDEVSVDETGLCRVDEA